MKETTTGRYYIDAHNDLHLFDGRMMYIVPESPFETARRYTIGNDLSKWQIPQEAFDRCLKRATSVGTFVLADYVFEDMLEDDDQAEE